MSNGQNADVNIPKPRRRGWFSLILGIAAGLVTCAYLPFTAFIAIGGGDFGVTLTLLCISGVQSIIGLFNISGLILGILALVHGDAGKGKAIAGLSLNVLALSLSVLILWFSITWLIKLS